MAGVMGVTIFISFVSVAVALGSSGALSSTLTVTPMKATTRNTPTLSVTIPTVAPAMPTSRTSSSVSEAPNTDPTGDTRVPMESSPSSPATEPSQYSQPLTPSQSSNGSTTTQTSTGFTADTTMNQTLTGIVGHDSTSSIFSSTLSPSSDFTTGNMSSSTALESDGRHVLSRSPGLVAVLCIFCICLGLLLAVGIAKLITPRGSTFQRLEDVPLGKINEESPFARYPEKQF
ncbi:cell wall protein RBR3 [Oncorhynchus mykiss]|uniref:cell wall protein RBR3 n=1 Tax=Oncorhynchus mykiss TaxID=8022 RepID=UPI0018778229|nr:cell wall protein RBR3 [Oncorhynchus mykiss]XP_021423072.2 cell wall protein RBR3 [Oncorhynchus mykiss]